ncbi:ABC transporter ATP-binding protein [Nocardiopsis alkaliphila]|uniref:ABC transporter ATP-binding protein n=1 Tax=Nocardiopsis alkaliphila TaxID=225762 RepID=UPI00034848C0|nr:ABC transporter ATP-binding protein [Nocardiopsis alkaliphila]
MSTENTTAAGEPVLRAHDLAKHFSMGGFGRSRKVLRAVDGVSLEIGRGQTLGLVGESGSGKTTVGRTLIRLYRPTSGTVEFEGRDITTSSGNRLRRDVRRRMAMVFQNPSTSLNPYLRLGEALAEPLVVHGIGNAAERRTRVGEMMELVGLDASMAQRYPQELSGGQRQRIGIARALITDPSLIIADEPTASLDVSVQAQIVNLLGDLQRELGLAYLFITHDLALVRHISHRVAVMYLGRLMEVSPAESLFTEPLHPYSTVLASMHQEREHRIVPRGDIPSPMTPPSGCVFRTRCPIAREHCATQTPPLREVAPGRSVACHHPGELKLDRSASGVRPEPVGVTFTDEPATRQARPVSVGSVPHTSEEK